MQSRFSWGLQTEIKSLILYTENHCVMKFPISDITSIELFDGDDYGAEIELKASANSEYRFIDESLSDYDEFGIRPFDVLFPGRPNIAGVGLLGMGGEPHWVDIPYDDRSDEAANLHQITREVELEDGTIGLYISIRKRNYHPFKILSNWDISDNVPKRRKNENLEDYGKRVGEVLDTVDFKAWCRTDGTLERCPLTVPIPKEFHEGAVAELQAEVDAVLDAFAKRGIRLVQQKWGDFKYINVPCRREKESIMEWSRRLKKFTERMQKIGSMW